MAYSFVAASSQYLKLTNVTLSGGNYPITVFVRAKSSDLSVSQVAATYIKETDTYNGLHTFLAGGVASDPIQAHGTNSTVSYADGAWHNITAISTGTTAHDVNVDDTVTSGSTSVTYEGYTSIQVGGRLIPTFSLGLTGSACTVALWNVALTVAECKSLNAGFPPRRVRPQSLVVYAPLVRDLQAWVNRLSTTNTFTNNNSATVSAHPRAYGL